MSVRLALPKGIDWFLLIIPVILVVAGIAVIYSLAPEPGPGKITLAVTQGIYAAIGVLLMLALFAFDYRAFRAAAPVMYGVGIGLLLAVLVIGSVQFGARRWIDLGPFQLQPSELMKLIALVALAAFFASRDELKRQDIAIALLILFVPAVLVTRQPDFGTAFLLVLGAIPIFLLSRISREQWIVLSLILVLAVPLIFGTLKPYQRQRLESFLAPGRDPFGAGYNVLQSTIAVGSGGLTGRGLGQGSQSTLRFVPVAHTDFIFAGIAEAIGFLGSSMLLVLFGILIARTLRLATLAQDRFGRLLAAGVASLWLFSVFINVGMNLGVAPVTGIPLPFVSFGGSSLITNFALAGILQSIHLRQHKISFR